MPGRQDQPVADLTLALQLLTVARLLIVDALRHLDSVLPPLPPESRPLIRALSKQPAQLDLMRGYLAEIIDRRSPTLATLLFRRRGFGERLVLRQTPPRLQQDFSYIAAIRFPGQFGIEPLLGGSFRQ